MLVDWRHDRPDEPGYVTKLYGPSAARMGCWKAHWGTGPGMGACTMGGGNHGECPRVQYPVDAPLLFNICVDPSEGMPLAGAANGSLKVVFDGTNGTIRGPCGPAPWCPQPCQHFTPCPPFNASAPGPSALPVSQAEIDAAQVKIVAAVKAEMAAFTYGLLVAPDLLPGELNSTVGVCCDKDPFKAVPANYSCDCDGSPYSGSNGPYSYAGQCL